jgi:hypothetical protein
MRRSKGRFPRRLQPTAGQRLTARHRIRDLAGTVKMSPILCVARGQIEAFRPGMAYRERSLPEIRLSVSGGTGGWRGWCGGRV